LLLYAVFCRAFPVIGQRKAHYIKKNGGMKAGRRKNLNEGQFGSSEHSGFLCLKQNFSCDRKSGHSAESSMFHDHRHHDARRPLRREACEPGMIPTAVRLGGAGLSAHGKPRDIARLSRSVSNRRTHHRLHLRGGLD
jgi:hypothetical protein